MYSYHGTRRYLGARHDVYSVTSSLIMQVLSLFILTLLKLPKEDYMSVQ